MENEFTQRHDEWLSFAEEALLSAQDVHKTRRFRTSTNQSQQSAEKSFKAYLAFRQTEILRVHDLVKLMNCCGKFDSTFFRFQNHCEILNKYISRSRYPDDFVFNPTEENVIEAFTFAGEIFEFVKAKIKP